MATTFEPLSFVEGSPITISGLTDDSAVAFVSVTDGEFIPVVNGEFSLTFANVPAATYTMNVSYFDADQVIIGTPEALVFEVTAAPVVTPPEEPTEEPTMSSEAQALIDKNSSSIQTYIPKYDVNSVESDTDNIAVYPGVGIGFGPLSASANATFKADEFKIMSDEALALNPSAGYTGGRGTGNAPEFGKYPERALMTDVRGEFFPKIGDFDPSTPTQYPLGRTADLLEGTSYPTGFTDKDSNGYSTTTTRGGANASPMPTSGFTF